MMAKPKTVKPVVTESVEQPKPQTGLIRVRVVHPVLGYKVGDEFDTSRHAVRFQLKHKSLIEI